MKVYRLYGEGAFLPELSDAAVEKAYKLWCMHLYTEQDALVWPKNRKLVVDWYKLDAAMEKRA